MEGTHEVGVVAIGTRQHAGRLSPSLGPVAEVLLQHAHCPVPVPTAR
ncbi:hypothetical protein ABT026_25435 [Streptomyces sp. NPDC002734]|uniref:UspA domain-containing protein n=1 Tax=Streptomyces fragilis TaxID=67301 RepID=A0ABV2YS32_9ACTN|nr:hypothetical protein [Streptomyces fragilis]